MDYSQYYSKLQTLQQEQALPNQVKNSAGGFTFSLDEWSRLERFLILGCEGGSYYATEKAMTIDNAKVVEECVAKDPKKTVETIVAISDSGRAPKNDPAVFALAILAASKDPVARALALEALPKVCRIGTHVFQFAAAVSKMRGWGRGLRKAVAKWYDTKDEGQLIHQVTKYQQRNGWSHRDLLRLSHASEPKHAAVYRWVTAGPENMGERKVGRKGQHVGSTYPALELPSQLVAFEQLKHADEATAVRLIAENGFTHEMVPSTLKGSRAVWEALFPKMPMHAMIRNLNKLTQLGIVGPMSAGSKHVCARLGDRDAIRKSRLHPVAILIAMLTYESGHGDKGKLVWEPERSVVDALDEAFYLAFDNVVPTGKNIMLALDISGSMGCGSIAGTALTPREGSAAMALVTARTEKNWTCVGFTSGAANEWRSKPKATGVSRSLGGWGDQYGISSLAISPGQRLDDVIDTISNLPMGGTDCSLPVLYAINKGLDVDAFVIYTDNETWAGNIHPHQALEQYRRKTGRAAKMVVVGMTSTEFTIADPSDPGMLDVVGFDAAAPAVIADFVRST